MPPLLTQKAREEQEEKRVLKRLEEKRRKEQGVEVVKSGWKPSAEQQAEGGVKGYGTKDKTITILGVKYNRPSASDFQKGTKTPPTFMPDPNKIY